MARVVIIVEPRQASRDREANGIAAFQHGGGAAHRIIWTLKTGSLARQIEKMPPGAVFGLNDPRIRIEPEFLVQALFYRRFR